MGVKKVFARRWRRHRQRSSPFVVAAVVFVCSVGLLGMAFFRCRPILTAFAESQAVWEATKIANRVAAEVLSDYDELCVDAITVTYTEDMKISSVCTDTAAINTVRTAMTAASMTAMEQFTSLSVPIPLGTLVGWDWLSGFGPLISFPISFTATVLSDVSSSLEAVGINQSCYRVLIHLEISLYVVTPGGRSTVGAYVSYPMAETVLLGEVPDNLTEVYGDDQSLLGQIFDYGTSQ